MGKNSNIMNYYFSDRRRIADLLDPSVGKPGDSGLFHALPLYAVRCYGIRKTVGGALKEK